MSGIAVSMLKSAFDPGIVQKNREEGCRIT